MPYTLRHNKSTECIPSDFFLFLLLESFDIRKNMFRRWQEDGGRILPTRFLTMAKQST